MVELSHLDDMFDVPTFHLPPFQCGHFTFDLMGESRKCSVRYMPRRKRYTGHYGIFYRDPDAGDVLIAIWEPERKEWKNVEKEFVHIQRHVVNVENLTRTKKACCWCGRDCEDGLIHLTCIKKSGLPLDSLGKV